MPTVRTTIAATLVTLVVGCACSSDESSDVTGGAGDRGGLVAARWTGADTGAISAPGAARWCHMQRLLQITAVQGDTGVGIALYLQERPAPGKYRVVDPLVGDTSVPRATTAARWLAPTVLRGFQGRSGTVAVGQVDEGRISGSFESQLHAAVGQDSIRVTGTFEAVPMSPMTAGCDPPKPGQATDSGIN